MSNKKAEPAPSLVKVAVFAALRDPLTYRVPNSMDLRVGQRVLVPLGRRRTTGIVVESAARVAPGIQVREVLRVLESEPVLSPELLTVGLWIAEYYLAPPGEVFRAMLPLRAETRRERLLALSERGKQRLRDLESSLLEEVRAGDEARFLRFVAGQENSNAGVPLETARRKLGMAFADLFSQAMAEGWLTTSDVERERGRRKVWSVRLAGPLPGRPLRLSPVGKRIMQALERGPADDHRALIKEARATLAHLGRLQREGWIELRESAGTVEAQAGIAPPALALTPAQQAVLDELVGLIESRRFHPALLHGVTASGKTEIYLRLIERALEQDRTALMLVPEIALTPAMQFQILARFEGRVAVLHSGLSESERDNAWWRARRGEARVVLGTRSAVFAPLGNLGVIIVDEEQEASYKQEETPRYHGRDVAVVRARLERALVVLGSATPSLESYFNAREGKYRLLKLEERIGGRPLAAVEIVDMRQEFRETRTQVPISRRLKEEIDAQLQAHAQTMILLNRRGYSWFLLCRSCGESIRCVNCSISLTYHRREQRLICHYCGYTLPIPSQCPTCGSEYLQYVGEGTEKLEAKLGEIFRGARVARLDRDVARRAGSYRKILADFREGKIDILVGTQLISKGHDFPGVTLVGVVSADQGLGLPDFRAAERTFQLLTQVAGRSGRGEAPGRVLVQTFFPEHYAVRLAADQNYEGFYSKEMRFRRMMRYPPCAALAKIVAQDTNLEKAARIAREVGASLSRVTSATSGFKVLGPASAPLAKIEGRYRIQLLIKSDSRARLNDVLRRLVDECEQRGIPPQSVIIDMDPISIM